MHSLVATFTYKALSKIKSELLNYKIKWKEKIIKINRHKHVFYMLYSLSQSMCVCFLCVCDSEIVCTCCAVNKSPLFVCFPPH